jgi:arylsulfatase A
MLQKASLLFFLLFGGAITLNSQTQKPNIIYILADDLGYGDVGCYGQKTIRTPNLDALAANGLRFTQHYAGAPVCAPSRAILMTGRDAGHCRVRGNYEAGKHGFGAGLELRDQDFTVAEMLKQRGYATGLVGKWGMGVAGTTGEPNKQGFDYSFGFLNQGHAHYQYPDYLFRNGQRVDIVENQNEGRKAYSNTLFTDEAKQFIEHNKHQAFFLYLAYTTPHAELLVPDDSIFHSYKGLFEEKPYILNKQGGSSKQDNFGAYNSQTHPMAAYAASITHLDMCVGQVVAQLKKLGLYENTLIVFSSDNGPAKEGGADPDFFKSSGILRGRKRDVYEGGIRVPMIVGGWSKLSKGAVSNHASSFQDVLTTLADVSGKKLEKSRHTEGVSFYPTLIGNSKKQRKHAYLYWEFHENKTSDQALLLGNWKGVRHDPNGKLELYNLASDPSETTDVADKHPSVSRQIETLLKTAREPHDIWDLKTAKNGNSSSQLKSDKK